MDEVPDVRGSLGTQYITPVFGKLPHPPGQTLRGVFRGGPNRRPPP